MSRTKVMVRGSPDMGRLLWTTVPHALATEIGALAVMLLGVVPGMAVAAAALLLLVIGSARVTPSLGAVRLALLLSGPPVRYALLFGSLWYLWAVRHLGPLTVLGTAVLLGVVIPLAGMLLAYAVRARATK